MRDTMASAELASDPSHTFHRQAESRVWVKRKMNMAARMYTHTMKMLRTYSSPRSSSIRVLLTGERAAESTDARDSDEGLNLATMDSGRRLLLTRTLSTPSTSTSASLAPSAADAMPGGTRLSEASVRGRVQPLA